VHLLPPNNVSGVDYCICFKILGMILHLMSDASSYRQESFGMEVQTVLKFLGTVLKVNMDKLAQASYLLRIYRLLI
jgi:hypothetical protein